MSNRVLLYILAVLVIIAAGMVALLMQTTGLNQSASSSGTALIGGPFSLIDQTGKRVTEADFKGRPTLVYFGFTYCPDVCPTELSRISEVLAQLGDDGADLTPVFITIDPERDTRAVMAAYVANFDPRIVGLTGTLDEITAAAKAYRVYFAKVEDAGSQGGYTMDHSAYVFLMSREGVYLAHFSSSTPLEEMVQKIRDLI